MTTTVGVIGLGVMGGPMAANVLAAGYDVVVHNRSRGRVDELVGMGATAASSPAEVGAAVDVVVTMLPDAPDVQQVLLGPSGVADGIRPGALVVDMSTSTPALARRLAAVFGERGVAVLDAPVSGGEQGAVSASLSIMAGGDTAAFNRALPVLKAMGATIVHVGGPGAGQVAKAANQILVGGTVALVAEALTLCRRSGVDPTVVREALLGGFADSRVLEVHGQRMLERAFEPGFRAVLHRKDLRIALEAATESGTALPTAGVVQQMFDQLVAAGRGDADHSALLEIVEERSTGG